MLWCKTAQRTSRGFVRYKTCLPEECSTLLMTVNWLWSCWKQAVGSAYKWFYHFLRSLGCCIHTGYACRATLPTPPQPASAALHWSYALNVPVSAISPYCHGSSTVPRHLRNNYENQILSFRKSTLYSSYCYCSFIDQNFVMLPDRNCSLRRIRWLAQLRVA